MKNFFFLLLPLWLFSVEPDKKLHEKSLYPTVKISYAKSKCDCEECKKTPGKAVASGFIVRSEQTKNTTLGERFVNTVITAAHNVENVVTAISVHHGIYDNWSTLTGFESYEATVYAVNKHMDLAILAFVTDKRLPCADVDMDSQPFFGTDVFKIGYGLGDDIRIDYGNITSVHTKQPEKLKGFLRSNCYTIFGDSGGPLFFRDGYKVMGVTSSIRGSDTLFLNNQSYFTPISWLKKWDDETEGLVSFIYKKDEKPPQILIYQLWLRDYEVKGTRK
jgi:S1-C subfamily serine protease